MTSQRSLKLKCLGKLLREALENFLKGFAKPSKAFTKLLEKYFLGISIIFCKASQRSFPSVSGETTQDFSEKLSKASRRSFPRYLGEGSQRKAFQCR